MLPKMQLSFENQCIQMHPMKKEIDEAGMVSLGSRGQSGEGQPVTEVK